MENIHKKDSEIKLNIIGDGLERRNLEQLIKAKNLSSCVKITGFLPQSEIAKYYHDSSLFVLTSKTEAFGLVLTEAMSYGLPCLALARASGAKAQLNNHIGFLIPNENINEIADKIINLVNHKTTLKNRQKAIDQVIKKYTSEKVFEDWRKILR